VDGDRLLVTPGGKDATLVALNKKTGEPIWKCPVPGGDGAGYASITIVQLGDRKEYVQFLGKGVVGVSLDGTFLWRYDKCANGTANASTPVFADGHLFAASAYGKGGALIRPPEGAGTPTEVYFTKKMENQHGGMLLIDGALYGANGGNGGGFLVCLDWKTGAVKWDERDRNGIPKGSVAFADGRIYYRQEDGTMLLIEPSTKECLVRGRFKQPDRSRQNAWPHPVIANGKLYLRDQDVLLCYDVAEKK
jgi:outer membrane protein assembly factor BamB